MLNNNPDPPESEHSMLLQIERRFLKDSDPSEWSEEDHNVYDFLNSMIDALDSGIPICLLPDSDEIKRSKIYKEAIKQYKRKI